MLIARVRQPGRLTISGSGWNDWTQWRRNNHAPPAHCSLVAILASTCGFTPFSSQGLIVWGNREYGSLMQEEAGTSDETAVINKKHRNALTILRIASPSAHSILN